MGAAIAQSDVWLHDTNAAQLMLETVKPDESDPSIAAGLHFARGVLAMETADPAGAAAEMETFGASLSNSKVNAIYPFARCWIARAEESAGHPDKADDLLKVSGTFLECYWFRGDILAGRGDLDGAVSKLKDAHVRGPHWADPLKAWGDVLAKQGHRKEALAKYDEALQLTPNWKELKAARGG